MSEQDDHTKDGQDEAEVMTDAGATPPLQRTARFGAVDEKKREGRLAGGKSPAREGFFERAATFISDTRTELKRVSWPTPNEVKNTTIITLIAVIFFAVYLYAVDQFWALLITQLGRLVTWLFGGA